MCAEDQQTAAVIENNFTMELQGTETTELVAENEITREPSDRARRILRNLEEYGAKHGRVSLQVLDLVRELEELKEEPYKTYTSLVWDIATLSKYIPTEHVRAFFRPLLSKKFLDLEINHVLNDEKAMNAFKGLEVSGPPRYKGIPPPPPGFRPYRSGGGFHGAPPPLESQRYDNPPPPPPRNRDLWDDDEVYIPPHGNNDCESFIDRYRIIYPLEDPKPLNDKKDFPYRLAEKYNPNNSISAEVPGWAVKYFGIKLRAHNCNDLFLHLPLHIMISAGMHFWRRLQVERETTTMNDVREVLLCLFETIDELQQKYEHQAGSNHMTLLFLTSYLGQEVTICSRSKQTKWTGEIRGIWSDDVVATSVNFEGWNKSNKTPCNTWYILNDFGPDWEIEIVGEKKSCNALIPWMPVDDEGPA
ncbi:hypothetical protein ACMFMG_011770 [Clarireedia jacksonii]